MTKKYFSTDLLNQAQSLRNAWAQINESLAIGELTASGLGDEIDQAQSLDQEIDRLETMHMEKCNERDMHYANIAETIKRTRSAVKGIYGDDSSQYEMVGGTRSSERKTRARIVAA